MRKTVLAVLIAATALPSAPAVAERGGRHHRLYDAQGRYYEPQRLSRNDRVWRGNDGRYHCRRGNGTTGLVIGGAVGALLGREIDGGRNRTLGTIVGAAGGALLGRHIDRGELRCR